MAMAQNELSFKWCSPNIFSPNFVAGVGFEPTTFRLWAWRATTALPRDKLYERTDKLSIFISYILGTVKEVYMELSVFV